MRLVRTLHAIVLLVSLLAIGASGDAFGQYPAKCDVDKSCVGNALTITATAGKGAQYVDVDTSYLFRNLSTALSFEAWIKPSAQPGKRQFIAGLWGPNKDNNDQWVFYIEDLQLTFALSHDGTYKGDADNTIVTATIPDIYTRGWLHVAAVWDGTSTEARIYVDGTEVGRTSNPAYPIDHLHPIESPTLSTQIGSCNALYDDSTRYRSFLGQMDEIRLWNRALSPLEVACQRLVSLDGNEPGLIMYLRCNEPSSTQFMCDACGNMNAKMRSGAFCGPSDRTVPNTFSVLPASATATLACTSDTTFSLTVTDTSLCGDQVKLSFSGPAAGVFSVSPASLSLTQNVPQTVQVSVHANQIGALSASLAIASKNQCGNPLTVPFSLNRTTELSYSKGRIDFDTLYVGCQETPYEEDTIKICNVTGRTITISSATFDSNYYTWAPAGVSQNLPVTLAAGACWTLIVRMDQQPASKTMFDTLRIVSDDRCPGSGIIPITGRAQEVIALLATDGKRHVDSLSFEPVCPNQISSVGLYQFRGLVSDTVFIDSITYTVPEFFGAFFKFPVKLAPKTAYQATYIRCKPSVPGPVSGAMHLYSHYRGCTIEKTITLKGSGISVDFAFDQTQLTFGNVTIGKSAQLIATVTNHGKDARRLASYLKVGDVFQIIAGSSFTINPGETKSITVEFRPRQLLSYVDTLAVFDEDCYSTIQIPITGTGVFESLSFAPPYLPIPDVIGCQCKTDTVTVQNISGVAQTITSDGLIDPSGKMTLVSASHAGPFALGATILYIVTYCPNDLAQDRADDAYIDIKLGNGEHYQVLVRATSVAPKLFVTPLTTFGVVEVGWQKQDSILVENASSVPLHVTGVNLPPGYSLIATYPPIPTSLAPRDSMWVVVEFKPTAEASYIGNITVTLDGPCNQQYAGVVTGRGELLKLEVPISFMNYGLIKPCDCEVRKIPLHNYSNLLTITIDSIWIDAGGLPNANPAVYSWRSSLTGGSTYPYTIPIQSEDTLLVSFCPNIPAVQANTILNAVLHVAAHTPGWSQTSNTVVSGGRELNFQPNKVLVSFPATRVDTSAAPVTVDITVPNTFLNPSGDSVVIVGTGFAPDQGVFSVVAASGQPLPWVIHRGQKFDVIVSFFPRAPKDYVARLLLYTSFPCVGVDTSILVMGSGFAPAFGLQMAFDTAKVGQDTIILNTCDTLSLPVMLNRPIPQDIIDIMFRLGYDTTAMTLVGIQSPYTANATIRDSSDGAHALLKDARNVEAGTIAIVKFTLKGIPKGFPISLDSIFFDSDSLVFFKIVAGIDKGYIEIDQPMISVTAATDFDTVFARNCLDRTVVVRNPGLIPVRFDSLAGLPKWHTVTASSVPYPVLLQPGDSIVLTVTFCPRAEQTFDTSLFAVSNSPCPVMDSGTLHSFGYAPPFPLSLLIAGTLTTADTIRGLIADTVTVPILIDRDFPLSPIDINYGLNYNLRSLEYMKATSSYTTPVVTQAPGGLSISLPGCDSIKKGEVARVTFVLAVPDTVQTQMILTPATFTSDSDLWITPVPAGDTSVVIVDPRCNISKLEFRAGQSAISVPIPNPSAGRVQVRIDFVEDAAPRLQLYNSTGEEVLTPLDGTVPMKPGSYLVEMNLARLTPGMYYLRFEAGTYRGTQKLIIKR